MDIRGSRNSLNLIPEALEVLNRHHDLAYRLITHSFELTQLGEAFETMLDPGQDVGKIVINMPASNPAF
ncbi:hypothetical protein NHF46_01330 [Arthrobacter alpinus]|nr:hypothetical protein [Arthrobacter alpinus]